MNIRKFGTFGDHVECMVELHNRVYSSIGEDMHVSELLHSLQYSHDNQIKTAPQGDGCKIHLLREPAAFDDVLHATINVALV